MKGESQDKPAVGATLPLLPLLDGAVLLPGGLLRVNAGSESTTALVEHLLRFRGSSGAVADLAAVPVVPATGTEGPSSDADAPGFDLDRLHSVGTAARVVELRRSPNNNWALVIEGRCRIKIREVTLSSPQGLYIAKIKQLDYFGGGQHARDSIDAASKDDIHQQRELLKGIKALFSVAQGARGELASRTLEILKVR